ncbi:hypothetical protein K435DRAFT_668921, partial [Dendrothele bispora CBS 962.96]
MADHIADIDKCFSRRQDKSQENVQQYISAAVEAGLFDAETSPFSVEKDKAVNAEQHGDCEQLVSDFTPEVCWKREYKDCRSQWKKSLKPKQANDAEKEPPSGTSYPVPQRSNPVPVPSIASLSGESSVSLNGDAPSTSAVCSTADREAFLKSVIERFTLNTEQERAFRIVADHSLQQGSPQLRMLLHGPGGTGKSHVIHALTEFFRIQGQERRLRLASFTGVAARNINGLTLHSACNLSHFGNGSKANLAKHELVSMWEGVDYLFVDEISMVGCSLLAEISEAL